MATPRATPKAPPVAAGVVTPVAWAVGFLRGIGAPVTANNIQSIIAWGTAESGAPSAGTPGSAAGQAHGGWNNFNPLNVVVQTGDKHTGQGGQQGNIADFGSLADGVAASVRLFTGNRHAAPIVTTLKGDQPIGIVNSAVNSFYGTWGGSINFSGYRPGDLTKIGATTLGAPGSASGSPLDAIVNAIPVIGGVLTAPLKAGEALIAIDKTILGLFTNWRYVLEVFVGVWLVVAGIVIILIDTGAARKAAPAALAVL